MEKVVTETDPRFPSGEWTGFYLQPTERGKRHMMELMLSFAGGVMHGEGRDVVGEFTLRGHYELDTGKTTFLKHYIGQHTVSYAGWNEGRGIWGTWNILGVLHGGFHIWPKGMADPTSEHLHESEELPAEEPVLVGDAPE